MAEPVGGRGVAQGRVVSSSGVASVQLSAWMVFGACAESRPKTSAIFCLWKAGLADRRRVGGVGAGPWRVCGGAPAGMVGDVG